MKIKNLGIIAFYLFLSGCASNPSIGSLTAKQKESLNTIQVSTGDLARPHRTIGKAEGLSCDRSAFSRSSANEGEAMYGARINAALLNADAIVNVMCRNNGVDWGNDCWSSIICIGDAVKFTGEEPVKVVSVKLPEAGLSQKAVESPAGGPDQKSNRELKREIPPVVPVVVAVVPPKPLEPALPVEPVMQPLKVAVPDSRSHETEIRGIFVGKEGVDIFTSTPVYAYTDFVLDKPNRIVIDIADGSNALGKSLVAGSRFGVAGVRIGNYPKKVRVVIDLTSIRVPQYKVEKIGSGLRIKFN